jgi:diacylglycerol kinase (ATP)
MKRYRNPPPINNTINRLSTSLVGTWRRQTARVRRIIVIVNPAAGQDRPILKALNNAMRMADVDWNLVITRQAGDGFRLARHAVAMGATTVIVYGGDGTINEVISGLAGTSVNIGIIQGGTSNFIANSLGIPRDISQALSVILRPDFTVHPIRLGVVNKSYFIQMVGIGLEANMVDGAGREGKDRFGGLAYLYSALQSIANPKIAQYHLELDDQVVDAEGVTCMIVNADNLLLPALTELPPGPRKGLLDVFIPQKADIKSIFSIAATMAGAGPEVVLIPHWQAHRITITSNPPQLIQYDGEILGQTPLTTRVTRRMVRVIIAPEKAKALGNQFGIIDYDETELSPEEPLEDYPVSAIEPED